MTTQIRRSTVYIRSDIHQAIRLKAAVTNQSISDIVNDALLLTLSEDEEDLRAFEERADEPNINHEDFLAKLKADGKI